MLPVRVPGGTPGNSLWECAAPVLQILTLFQTKRNVIFHTRFQIRPLKSIPVFRPVLQAEIMSSLLRIELKQKISSNAFRFSHINLFLSYSFGITTFIRSRGSLENHTRFRTNMGKVYTLFQTKKGAKTIAFGAAHTYIRGTQRQFSGKYLFGRPFEI